MHHTVYILTSASLANFVQKTSKKLAFSIKFALFLSPSLLCSFSCALPLSYVFLSKDLSITEVGKAKRARRSHMTHTLQSCDKEWKKRGQKCGREYKWALVLVMWRGYMFLSTQKFEEEKLGKVERKVEPEKQRQLQVGVCLGTVGRSSAFSS